jgi:hypothetical protein
MPFLTAKAFDFGDGQAGDAAFGQSLTDLFKLEGFDDGSDLFHIEFP